MGKTDNSRIPARSSYIQTLTDPKDTMPATEELFLSAALNAWNQWTTRLSAFIETLTDQELLTPVAPGKNRAVYILGHLLVVNDAMILQLRLGEPSHADLIATFLTQPDGAVADLPPLATLRADWKALNARLDTLLTQLTPAQWLERHALVSEEDFAREPHRNRLSLLLSRTSHNAYHLGQLRLRTKSE
jgi:DinB superfamily